MASDLRKGIALGAGGTIGGGMQDYRNQRRYLDETNTPWVRLWAHWPTLQPASTDVIGERPASLPPDRPNPWDLLDQQIQAANANQRYVILTALEFPTWCNQNAWNSKPPDEVDPNKYATYYVPDSVAVDSAWSRWIEHLILRYNAAYVNNKGFIHCLEICNEPNIQFRPQAGVHNVAANMMRTALSLKQRWTIQEFWPIILAPATGDTTELSRYRTPYESFTSNVLSALGTGFRPGGYYGWSHHNHRDIELDAGVGGAITTKNRAKTARDLLKGRWWGWGSPNDPNNPRMFLTEGGGRLDVIHQEWYAPQGLNYDQTRTRDKQAQLLQSNYNRMKNETEGAGIAMLMQYLVTSSYVYDTGLRDAYTYRNEIETR